MSDFAFFSHSSSDDSTVNQLNTKLSQLGIKTWVDHSNIMPGTNWNRAIEKAMEDCLAGLLLLTPSSEKSDECECEWRTLIAFQKRLYIAVLGEPKIPWRLRTFQYVNLNTDIDESLDILGKAMQLQDFPINIATDRQVKKDQVGTLMPIRRHIFRTVRLVFDISIEIFKSIRDGFIKFLSRILGISKNDISILGFYRGSTVVTIQLPIEAAELLVEVAARESQLFNSYRLISCKLLDNKAIGDNYSNKYEEKPNRNVSHEYRGGSTLNQLGILGRPNRLLSEEDDDDDNNGEIA